MAITATILKKSVTKLQEMIQEVIDNYKTEQTSYNANAFSNLCATIQNNLILT